MTTAAQGFPRVNPRPMRTISDAKDGHCRSPEVDAIEPLAIIGLAFDFPQDTTSDDKFWNILSQGKSTSTEFPSDRLNIDAFYHPDENRPSTLPLRQGHFLDEDPGAFDAPFFSITPGEAACMDPQHRRLLEVSYHALENAGIPVEKCAGSDTAVYTGCFTNDYLSILQQDHDVEQRHAALGVAPSLLANRISWFYNFKGTSTNLDSACSSSLLALHVACQDLRAGNSSMALVGGANMVYHPNFMKILSDFGFLSPDGQCWSFDQRANGYARGEGIAFVVVKRLCDALANGDTIRAVVRNTGSNQDGRTPAIMQPSKESQMSLINDTFRRGGIDMGTDKILRSARDWDQSETFQQYRNAQDPLFIGAVKANLGHLEGCSGLAGLIRTILILEKGVIPPIANLNTLNNKIDAKSLHLQFPTANIAWPGSGIRRACVNSFGFGGTNAIAILDDAEMYLKLRNLQGYHRTQRPSHRQTNEPHKSRGRTLPDIENSLPSMDHSWVDIAPPSHDPTSTPPSENELSSESQSTELTTTTMSTKVCERHVSPADGDLLARLFLWSAPNEDAIGKLSDMYHEFVLENVTEWDNVAYTLAAKRSRYKWNAFIVGRPHCSPSPNALVPSKPIMRPVAGTAGVAFVFTGQGTQYVRMGIELWCYTVFLKSLEFSNECLRQLGSAWDLFAVIRGHSDEPDINLPEYSQPLTTCLQIALVDLLRSIGVIPSVVLGHSSGEIAASYAAGALSRFSAIKVAYHRGRLCSRISRMSPNMFTMMAIGLSKQKIVPYIERLRSDKKDCEVAIGCVNSPKSVTLSGRREAIEQLEIWLHTDSIFTRKLKVSLPYHTHFMAQIASEYATALGNLEQTEPECGSVTMLSSVTGGTVSINELRSAEYWVRNLISPVEFEVCFESLLDLVSNPSSSKKTNLADITVALEIGPHGALRGPIREIQDASARYQEFSYVSTLVRGENASVAFLEAMGRLYCAGSSVDLLKANDLAADTYQIPSGMPQYSFDHTQTYWIESSLSRNLRFREQPRHDLLGTRSIDWNPCIAQWRNIMRLDELPWLQDHKIGSEIVVPAAGMIAMAIEGLLQLIPDRSSQLGIEIEDMNLLHAMSFPGGINQIETQLTVLQPSQGGREADWAQFRLFVLEDDEYIECCTGNIRAVFSAAIHSQVLLSGPWGRESTACDWANAIKSASQTPREDPYDLPQSCKVRYGPSFQNLDQMKLGPEGEVTAQIDCGSWHRRHTSSFAQAYVIHPTTLDGLAQPLFQALAVKRPGKLPTMMPVHVDQMWIGTQTGKQHTLDVAARCKFSGSRGGHADVLAFDPDNTHHPRIFIKGLNTAFIDADVSSAGAVEKPRRLCMKLMWKPDLGMMNHTQVLHHCTQNRPPQPPDAVKYYGNQCVVLLCFIDEALKYIDQHPHLNFEWQFKYYIDWMRHQQARLQSGESLVSSESVQFFLDEADELDKLKQQVEDSDIDGFFFVHIGRQMIQILLGEIDPLEVIFKDGLADRYYEKMLGNDHHAFPASVYVDLLSFKNPSLAILEVGAGTGGQTKRLLETMSSDGVSKWSSYDYTDISPRFFEHAKERLSHMGNMNFRVLDISQDPVSQNFQIAHYDLVIASHVLHATDVLVESLRNVRKLLKPNGKLLLFETTRPEAIPVGFAFGLLKGWWSPLHHEPRSPFSPCVDVDQWDILLKDAGFFGVDVEIPGQEELFCRDSSIIIATAKESPLTSENIQCDVHLVLRDDVNAEDSELIPITKQLCYDLGLPYKVATLSQFAASDVAENSLVIFLTEVDSIFLDEISETDFERLQSVIVRSKNTIWVSRADAQRQVEPRHHLAVGLGRALTAEDGSRKFLTLALDPLECEIKKITKAICDVTHHVVYSTVECIENNMVISDGKVQVCRVTENSVMDETVAQALLPYQLRERRLFDGTQFVLRFEVPGEINSAQWVEIDARDREPLDRDEINVQVRAVGLAYEHYLIAKAQLNETEIGTEYAGYILEAGEDSGFSAGDRVCLIAQAMTARSAIRTTAQSAVTIPAHMSFAEAVSMASNMWLSYLGLISTARLQKQDTILIHQGEGGISDILIQTGQSVGARVLVTVNTRVQAEYFRREYGLSDFDILNLEEKTLVEEMKRTTNHEGVDVIIGASGGSIQTTQDEFAACLAPCGRFIDISICSQDATKPSIPNALNMSKTTLDMTALLRKSPETMQRIFQQAMKFAFAVGIKGPRAVHTLPAHEAKEAFVHFEDNGPDEKRVIELSGGDPIIAVSATKPSCKLPLDATYVIGGGLGGLGRSFARWLVTRGARYLILLSRSGAVSDEARRLVCELQAEGVHVSTPAVDLTNLGELKAVLESSTSSMPPIKGCIQATVALRDSLFPKMSYEDWAIAARSKGRATWNLHEALPSGLDFFVTLSSINGMVGGRGQANYTAGNTYMDAVVHHRISNDEKAVTFNLGVMVSEGIVAENADLLANMRRIGHLMDISQAELLALLDYYCDPSLPILSHEQAQILIGLETAAAVRAKNIDLHHIIHRPLFRQLFQMDIATETVSKELVVDHAASLQKAASDSAASDMIMEWYQSKVAHMLGLKTDEIDVALPVRVYGMDSLMAIDLKNWFAREIGCDIQVFHLLGNKSLAAVAMEAAQSSRFRSA
ncbi:lovastatin nonaketide synthase [Xylariaceae sp. FL0255]|nr:lovastatin nonaketide synthase [Xylariaceae sp. FL0255]